VTQPSDRRGRTLSPEYENRAVPEPFNTAGQLCGPAAEHIDIICFALCCKLQQMAESQVFEKGKWDLIEIAVFPNRGRGIRAKEDIAAGTKIDVAPVILLKTTELATLSRTIVNDYWFWWDGEQDATNERGAIALGIISLVNHSAAPNTVVARNFEQEMLELIAKRDIKAGEEITCSYQRATFEVAEGSE